MTTGEAPASAGTTTAHAAGGPPPHPNAPDRPPAEAEALDVGRSTTESAPTRPDGSPEGARRVRPVDDARPARPIGDAHRARRTDDAVPVDPYAEAVVPVLRGVSHAYAAWVAAVGAVILVVLAPDGAARACAAGYGAALVALFGISGALHRRRWTARQRRVLRRLDHCSIHVFIAACSTLVAVLLLDGTIRTVVLATAWAGAAGGIALSVAWIAAPRELTSTVYVLIAGSALLGAPQVADQLPAVPTGLLLGGVVAYAAGSVVYALKRPNPAPLAFGYHEVFHVLVIAAATLHYAAFAGWVVPAG